MLFASAELLGEELLLELDNPLEDEGDEDDDPVVYEAVEE